MSSTVCLLFQNPTWLGEYPTWNPFGNWSTNEDFSRLRARGPQSPQMTSSKTTWVNYCHDFFSFSNFNFTKFLCFSLILFRSSWSYLCWGYHPWSFYCWPQFQVSFFSSKFWFHEIWDIFDQKNYILFIYFLGMSPILCGLSSWTHQQEDGARRQTISLKAVILVTVKIKSMLSFVIWFKKKLLEIYLLWKKIETFSLLKKMYIF